MKKIHEMSWGYQECSLCGGRAFELVNKVSNGDQLTSENALQLNYTPAPNALIYCDSCGEAINNDIENVKEY